VTLNEDEFVEKRKKLEKFLAVIRIEAEIEVCVYSDLHRFSKIVIFHSNSFSFSHFASL
jgi:hypothetical protein